jgi:hypothetical protein
MEDGRGQCQRYGLINARGVKTPFGDRVVKFSFFSPLFAASVVKFLEANENDTNAALFASFVFYVIENSKELIATPTAACFVNSFSQDSDLVTVYLALEAVLAVEPSADEVERISKAGLAASFVLELRQILVDVALELGTHVPPNQIVTDMRDWVTEQPGQALGLIDSLLRIVNTFNPSWLTLRTGRFVQVIGADSYPAVVYAVDGFADGKLVIEGRPGWKGLIAPGACYVLSVRVNKTTGSDSGSLIHRIAGDATPGVVCLEVEPVLNSPFFTALVQAYLGEQAAQKFVAIQMTRKTSKRSAFLIHLTQSGNVTYLNYCPRTADTGTLMKNALPVIRKLLPFVPRAVLIKRDHPVLVVEMYSVGSSSYDTHLHLYANPGANVPVAYNVNAAVIEHAAKLGNKLADAVPAYRFAITGECLSYRSVNGRPVDLALEPPNTSPALSSVFSQAPSHLVLLVDKGEPVLAGQPQLPWVPPGGIPKLTGFVDQTDLLELASDTMAVQGTVTRGADFWVVTLGDAKLKVKANRGSIPKELWSDCGSTNGTDATCTFLDLVRIFGRYSIGGERGLSRVVPVKELDSAATPAPNKAQFETAFRQSLANELKRKPDDIQFLWLGRSAFAVRVEKVDAAQTRHPLPATIDDQSYQPCALDAVVRRCVPAAAPATSVVHVPCVCVTIVHFRSSGMKKERFEAAVDSLQEQYGFFVVCKDAYQATTADAARLGEMSLEVCDHVVAVSLAQAVTAQIPVDSGFDSDALLMSTRTLAAQNFAARRPAGYTGPEPRVKPIEAARGIPTDRVDAVRNLVRSRAEGSPWRFDEKFRVLIVPVNEEDELRRLLMTIKRDEGSALCFYECDGKNPDDVLPQPTHVFRKDGSASIVAMCRPCLQVFLTGVVGTFFNPGQRLIVQAKLAELRERLEPLPAEASEQDPATNQAWPIIPLGALLCAYLSDRRGIAGYAKAWVTGVAEAAVRCAAHIFTACPDHPQFLMAMPAAGQNVKCDHCNMFMCGVCRTWHKMDKPCDMGEIAGAKRCPRCRTPIFKTQGCNHITCKCGCHWCYKCTQGFDQSDKCYAHMTAAHGGYYADPWK